MAIKTEKTTKETVKAMAGRTVVAVYFTDGDPKKVTIGWPQPDGSSYSWREREVLDYPEVLPDLYKAIGEAMEYIQLAKA